MKDKVIQFTKSFASNIYIYIYRVAKNLAKFKEKLNFRNYRSYIKSQNLTRTIGLSASAVFAALMTLAALPITERTSTAEAATGTATESKTTIAITKANADLTINPNSADGTFATSTDSEKASFSVSTTNYTGYTLTIKASDDNRQLSNNGGTGVFNSIDAVIDEKTFDASTYNGKWGYKPNKMNSTENVGFWPSPTTSATTLDITKEASTNSYNIALGARADYSQATGTYTKTTILTATGNPANYSITYTDNTGDSTVKNLPDTTNSTTSGTTIALSGVTPSRTGYVFNGWCSVAPTSSGTVCSGTTYQVGGNYGIDQTTTNVTTLYATWKVPTYSIIIKPTTGVTSVKLNDTTCTNTAGCTVSGLVYGQTYNLVATMTSGYTFAGWSNSGAGMVAGLTTASTTFKIGEGTSTITAIAYKTQSASTYSLTVNFSGAGITKVEVRTAAGTGGTLVGTISSTGGSISGLTSGTMYYLKPTFSSGYTAAKWTTSGGYLYCTNTLDNCNSESNPRIIIGTSNSTVTASSAYVMQNFTASMCAAQASSGNVTVYDARDGQGYTVRYINNKCWMTRNIAIGCNGSGTTYGASYASKTLTSSTSNVSANFTTPTTTLASGGNTYDTPLMTCSNTYGAWYNYAAASAGTITGSSNTTVDTYNICPKGWTLPTNTEQSGIVSSASAFSPVTGGYWYSGSLYNTGDGYWWSLTAYNATVRYNLDYNGSSLSTGSSNRDGGFYVRCVRSS